MNENFLKLSQKIYRLPLLCLVWMITLAAYPSQMQAQTKESVATGSNTVKGVVTDQSKQPIVGASVVIKGTTRGTSTNIQGQFTINAFPKDTLVINMLGMTQEKIYVGNRTSFNVRLSEDTGKIEEVVITVGYGQTTVRDLTGSVASVDMNDLLKAPVASFDQALAGKVAGVTVTSTDGQPGADMDIVIRGNSSLTQSNAPLYVVDGFQMEDFSAAALNTNDIASIAILKDASSTAIYGSRGANGVVIIETKKGLAGKPIVEYNATVGLQTTSNRMDMMNTYEYVSYLLELNPSYWTPRFLTNLNMTQEDYRNVPTHDWQDKVLRQAIFNNHSVSLSGGGKDSKYLISGSYVSQDGVIINSGYEKYQGRINFSQKISKKLTMTLMANYFSDKQKGQISLKESTNNSLMYRTWTYPPVELKGLTIDDSMLIDEDGLVPMNPVISSSNEVLMLKRQSIVANVKLEYNILPSLKFTGLLGANSSQNTDERFYNEKTYRGYPSASNSNGMNGSYSNNLYTVFTSENTLTWKKRIRKMHNIDLMGGFSVESKKRTNYGFGTNLIPDGSLGLSGLDEGIPVSAAAAISSSRMMSVFGRVNYRYGYRFYFTASLRADGSSKFAPGHKWGLFPSGAVSWNMTEEKFLKKNRVISKSKLRASYGATGNNRISDFGYMPALKKNVFYSFNNSTPSVGVSLSSYGNKELRWEITRQLNVGYDLGLFKSRLNFTVDLYRKTTSDLLLNADIPYSTGVAKEYMNIGKVRNDGLEITINSVNISNKNFTWSTDFNISFNRSKVLALAENQKFMTSNVSLYSHFNNATPYIAMVGGPIAAFFGAVWDGVYSHDDFDGNGVLKGKIPANGNDRSLIKPGDIKFKDLNGDGTINSEDYVPIGRCLPIHSGGMNNNFTYKNFNLSLFFQWSYGNDILNANRIALEGDYQMRAINQLASYAERWTPENSSSTTYRANGFGPQGIYSDRTIEDGSYIRLKTAQFSYTFPKRITSKLGLRTLQVMLSGQNLYTWTKYTGMDPEVSTRPSILTPGYDFSAYPRSRTFTIGIKATF